MSSRKTVAVIGAGPAGLVAAKSMLEAGLAPTLFDRAPTVGGMWAARAERGWEGLRTNLSRYSCGFSDHLWPDDASMFPTRREVDAYLSHYADTFLRDSATFCLGREVKNIRRDEQGFWRVRSATATAVPPAPDISDDTFDHVVVASGFFATPIVPELPGLADFAGPVLHSDTYRNADPFVGKHVAVVGASLSAAEIAADLAPVAARVTHVASKPFHVIPRYIPQDAGLSGSPLLPLDLVFYRRYVPGPQRETLPRAGQDNTGKHHYMQTIAGDYARLVPRSWQFDAAQSPLVSISDQYVPALASGRIDIRPGRVTGLAGSQLSLAEGAPITDVDAVVLCTGYRPCVSFFDTATREQVQWDESDTFMPLSAHHSVFHPALPQLAFVGMYRGPYFAVMEAQARWAAAVFAGTNAAPTDAAQTRGIAREIDLKNLSPRPQFPHGDYVGLLDETYSFMQVTSTRTYAGTVVIPAHYRPTTKANKTVTRDLESTLQSLRQGAAAAPAIFQGLGGRWAFERNIISQTDSTPPLLVRGEAEFAAQAHGNTWYYEETGEAVAQAHRLQTWQAYRYSLTPATHQLSVHFVRGQNAGEKFHDVSFGPAQAGNAPNTSMYVATAEHLCAPDHYNIAYRFDFTGSMLSSFEITYEVQGPKKDYLSRTTFRRPALRL